MLERQTAGKVTTKIAINRRFPTSIIVCKVPAFSDHNIFFLS